MTKLIINLIFSTILAPFNLYCSSWIFKDVLNLSGITFNEFIKRNSNQYYGDSHREQARKRNHIFRFLTKPALTQKVKETFAGVWNQYTADTCSLDARPKLCIFTGFRQTFYRRPYSYYTKYPAYRCTHYL